MVPGTSRSGATIIGGLLFGLSRKAATGFSFFLAMPTMVGAAVYSGYKYRDLFRPEDLPVFAVGFVTSFVFAMLAVRALLKFIGNHSYAAFAWYRIAFGLLILATWQFPPDRLEHRRRNVRPGNQAGAARAVFRLAAAGG